MVYYQDVQVSYFDEERNFWLVDAWRTTEDDEEGRVVGVIHTSGDYYIFDYDARLCDNVRSAVSNKVKEILDSRSTLRPQMPDISICPAV